MNKITTNIDQRNSGSALCFNLPSNLLIGKLVLLIGVVGIILLIV